MVRHLGVRLLQLVAVVAVVTLMTYWMLSLLPGDPCLASIGSGADENLLAECRAERHLDEPVISQWAQWLGQVLRGDLGRSYRNGITLTSALSSALPRSLLLVLYSQITAVAFAVPLGIYSAYRKDKAVDRIISGGAFALLAAPAFVLGIILALFFATDYVKDTVSWFPFSTNWFDLSGYSPISDGLLDHLKVMTLPSITLAAGLTPVYLRLLRTDVVQTLQEDFVGVAKAKGMPQWHILARHVLRPSSFTLLTVAGINAAAAINGAIIVETIYDLDGVGSLLVSWVLGGEFLMVQTLVALIAMTFVAVNLAVDVFYAILDPRVRKG